MSPNNMSKSTKIILACVLAFIALFSILVIIILCRRGRNKTKPIITEAIEKSRNESYIDNSDDELINEEIHVPSDYENDDEKKALKDRSNDEANAP